MSATPRPLKQLIYNIDGIGDFFGTCRLANQLDLDIEYAFNLVKKEILAKDNHQNSENNIVKK